MNTARHTAAVILLIVAGACAAYGAMIWGTRSGTAFFVVWILLASAFVMLAAMTFFRLWGRIPRAAKVCAAAVLCICLVIFAAFEACVISHFDDGSKAGESGKLDYIIVLGAQVYKSGPSTVLRYRLDRAAEYLTENQNTVCIVTGGQGYNEPSPEGEVMADYLVDKGISGERIITETESETTAQNISNSMRFIEEGATVGIVTNNFHVFRALQIAEKQGLNDAVGIAAGSHPAYLPNNMLREFFAEIKLLLF